MSSWKYVYWRRRITNCIYSADLLDSFLGQYLAGLTTVEIPVSSKFHMFCGQIGVPRCKTSFRMSKNLDTTGRLNPMDLPILVDSGLRSARVSVLLRNPLSQSSPAASLSFQYIFVVHHCCKLICKFACLYFCQAIKHF